MKMKRSITFIYVLFFVLCGFFVAAQDTTTSLVPGSPLFVVAQVDKKECFAGEPLVATFTLFSRVNSSSEVIKNPGFYGFSVVDVPHATEQPQGVQNRYGTFYITHVLRKVQLYPLQTGTLLIDEMSVNNVVDKIDGRGAITQGEELVTSNPITIRVKALPPTDTKNFSGAVGSFSMAAHLNSNKLHKNESGQLVVTISGKGNFLQVDAPDINWPQGIEGFDAVATDNLQKDKVPISGSRQYTYNFALDKEGTFVIPPVLFTYFNPVTKQYKTIKTDSLRFTVLPAVAQPPAPVVQPAAIKQTSVPWGLIAAFGAVAILLFAVWRNKKVAPQQLPKQKPVATNYEEQIKQLHVAADNEAAYYKLELILLNFLKTLYQNDNLTKENIAQLLAQKNIDDAEIKKLQFIFNECEVVQYYNAHPSVSFAQLQQQALAIIKELKKRR